jgi:hypothetical protein
MGRERSERAMCAARKRRLAAGLLVLSMFSCSYGDREDKEEDDANKRTALTVSPAMAAAGIGRAGRLVTRDRPRSVGFERAAAEFDRPFSRVMPGSRVSRAGPG